MLTRIRLKNIQKHKDLTLNLDKINVVTGATDTGKTSIFRGLLWGLTNNEAGENLINNEGAKSCSVLINVDGHEVERSWTKSKNAYRLDDKEFTTFRTTVPSPIESMLNMTELNIQGRRDLPFMVYYKASECASQLSEMLDLDEIDSTIANVNRAVKAKTEDVDLLKQHLKESEEGLKKYEHLDEATEAFERIDGLYVKLMDTERRLADLTALQQRIEEASEEFERVPNPYMAVRHLKELDAIVEKVKHTEDAWYELSAVLTDAEHAQSTVKRLAKAEQAYHDLAKLAEHAKRIKEVQDKKYELETMITLCREGIQSASAADNRYTVLRKEFEDAFPEVCPLCGGTYHAF